MQNQIKPLQINNSESIKAEKRYLLQKLAYDKKQDLSDIFITDKNSLIVISPPIDPFLDKKRTVLKSVNQLSEETNSVLVKKPFVITSLGSNCKELGYEIGDKVLIQSNVKPNKIFFYKNVQYIIFDCFSIACALKKDADNYLSNNIDDDILDNEQVEYLKSNGML
jgi:hypothetical protein